jgi:hypothetical protein
MFRIWAIFLASILALADGSKKKTAKYFELRSSFAMSEKSNLRYMKL